MNALNTAVKLAQESTAKISVLSPYRDDIKAAFPALSASQIAAILSKQLNTTITKDRVLRFLHKETDLFDEPSSSQNGSAAPKRARGRRKRSADEPPRTLSILNGGMDDNATKPATIEPPPPPVDARFVAAPPPEQSADRTPQRPFRHAGLDRIGKKP